MCTVWLRVDLRSLILQLTRDCVTLLYGVYKVQYIMAKKNLDISVSDDLRRNLWAKNFSDISGELGNWIEKLEKATNCQKPSDFSLRNLKKLSVDVLAKLVFEGYQIGTGYTGCIDDARSNAVMRRTGRNLNQS